jgi:hypothetical protein
MFDGPDRHCKPADQEIYRVLREAGVAPWTAQEVLRRLAAINGGEIEVPKKFDTAMFLDMQEGKLYRALLMLDNAVIASAGPRDLTQMINMILKKRNLLKREPTVIIRQDQREGLNRVAGLLLAEMRRRGIQIDAMAALEATPGIEEVKPK